MKIDHFLLAKGSSIDRESNSLSIFEMLDEITLVQAQPPYNIFIHFLAVFVRENEIGEIILDNLRINIISQEAQEINAITIEKFKIDANLKRMRARGTVPFVFEKSGRYTIKVTANHQGKEIYRECSLDIIIATITSNL